MSPPIILDERAPGVAAAAAASEAAFAAGRADRELARLAILNSILNFFKPVPRAEAVAAAAGRQAEQRALREQRAKEVAAVAKRGQRQVASH
jgi:hypothetical protein